MANRGVAQAERSTAKSVEHALRAGELLTKAKAEVKHGQWEPWLRANFEFTQQTANGYMRLWEQRQITGARDLPRRRKPDGTLQPESIRAAHRKLDEERRTREAQEKIQRLKSAETRKEAEAVEAEYQAEYERDRPERERRQAEYEKMRAASQKREAEREEREALEDAIDAARASRAAEVDVSPAGKAAIKVEGLVSKALMSGFDSEAVECIKKSRQLVSKHKLVIDRIRMGVGS